MSPSGSKRPPQPDPLGEDPALDNLISRAFPAQRARRPGSTRPAEEAQGLETTLGAATAAPANPASPSPAQALTLASPAATAQAMPFPAAQPVINVQPMLAADDHTRQATVQISVDLEKRFRRFQRQLAGRGPRPSNGLIIFDALNAAQGRYREIVDARRPQPDPSKPFGSYVPGRRRSLEAKPTLQLSFRPGRVEWARIEQLAEETGAGSITAFIEAILDAYLPPAAPRSS